MANELVARNGLRVSGSTFLQTVSTDQNLLNSVLAIDPSTREVKLLAAAGLDSQVFVSGGTVTGTGDKDLLFTNTTGGTFTVTNGNVFLTGGTYDDAAGQITFTNNSGGTFQVGGWDYFSAATISSNQITLTDNGGADTNLQVVAITGLTDYSADSGVWGVSYAGTGAISTSPLELPFITGGSYNAGTISLGIKDGLESAIQITGLTNTDTHVTGGTLTQSTGEVELTFNQGYGPVTLTGAFEFVTGGTLTDNGITLETNLGNTDSLGTVTALTGLTQTNNDVSFAGSNGATGSIAIDAVTGGTFDPSTGIITVEGSNNISNIDLGTDFVTGVTEANNIITVGNAGAGTTDYNIQAFTGATISDNDITLSGSDLIDVTLNVSAITEVAYSDWGISGSSFNVAAPSFELPFITGGSYNQGTGDLTLSINGGVESDIVISGFEGADTYVTGGTLSQAAGTVTLEYTDGDFGPVTLTGAFEFVTGGTLLDNAITLETNLGNTDSLGTVTALTGLTQTNNDVSFVGSNGATGSIAIDAITGATFSLATGDITWEGSNSYDATLSLGTDFVTGVTEANNVISVTKNGGAVVNSTIQAITGISYSSDWAVSFSGTGTLSTSPFELPFITGGTYAGNPGQTGTLTLGINGGLESDITITGFSGSDTFVTGATVEYSAATLTRNDDSDIKISSEQTLRVTGSGASGTLFNVSPSDYKAVHVEYTMTDGTAARSGFFTAIFHNSGVEYADWSTMDLGTFGTNPELAADASGNVTFSGGAGLSIIANTRAVAINA
jgi:hypothetical protein